VILSILSFIFKLVNPDLITMKKLLLLVTFIFLFRPSGCQNPVLPGVKEAVQKYIDAGDISGAVTVVVTKDRVLHIDAEGLANIKGAVPMNVNSIFWIASMTKPVTATAVLMLRDEGKLDVRDPVSKYIPEFSKLRTPSGKPAGITIAQILTHTSGLGEARSTDVAGATTLADLIPFYLSAPMQFEPGAMWKYTQSGINVAARIVEVVSGMSFDMFIQKRLLDPLGMKNSTFYPDHKPIELRATGYSKNKETGKLEPAPYMAEYSGKDSLPPLGNGGLFSSGPDYARFCRMLLNGGSLDGKHYLGPESMELLTNIQTGDLECGFMQAPAYGSHGSNYGWGIGTCILRKPHEGVATKLSPGTFGHGGAWGTQAWIDPVEGIAYILMVQRSDFPNSDASDLRKDFQLAAYDAFMKISH
jgi:CubicO group peptidase (beta-lactamase class C family)